MTNTKRDEVLNIFAIISMIVSSVFMLCMFLDFIIRRTDSAQKITDWITALSAFFIGITTVFIMHKQFKIMAAQKKMATDTRYYECYEFLVNAIIFIQTIGKPRPLFTDSPDLADKPDLDRKKYLEGFVKANWYAEIFDLPEEIQNLCSSLLEKAKLLLNSCDDHNMRYKSNEDMEENGKRIIQKRNDDFYMPEITPIFRKYTKVIS